MLTHCSKCGSSYLIGIFETRKGGAVRSSTSIALALMDLDLHTRDFVGKAQIEKLRMYLHGYTPGQRGAIEFKCPTLGHNMLGGSVAHWYKLLLMVR